MTRIDPYLEALGITALWQRRPLVEAAAAGQETADVGPATAEQRQPTAGADQARAAAFPAAIQVDPVPAGTHPAPTAAAQTGGGNARAHVSDPDDIAIPDADAVSVSEAKLPLPTPSRDGSNGSNTPVAELGFDALRDRVLSCTACRLCETRTQAVFGVGDRQADWMFVGEGPGANEDEQGEPFVGQAGKLLDNMLLALGLNRESGVFIANVVKCRPPGNRDPMPDEVAACEAYLQRQIALIQPRIIVALGRFAAQTLLKRESNIGALRGTVHQYEGVPVIATYHPAYLLRTLTDKAKAWQDLCLARSTFAQQSTTPIASPASSSEQLGL